MYETESDNYLIVYLDFVTDHNTVGQYLSFILTLRLVFYFIDHWRSRQCNTHGFILRATEVQLCIFDY